jgi:hypothetical protein
MLVRLATYTPWCTRNQELAARQNLKGFERIECCLQVPLHQGTQSTGGVRASESAATKPLEAQLSAGLRIREAQ